MSAETACVTPFLDALVGLRLPTWLAIGRELIANRGGLPVRQAAWSDVECALAAHGLALAAWQVRDELETASCLVCRPAPRWTREERCRFAATQGAADAAALSLLARGHLPTDLVRTLYAPFAPFIGPLL